MPKKALILILIVLALIFFLRKSGNKDEVVLPLLMAETPARENTAPLQVAKLEAQVIRDVFQIPDQYREKIAVAVPAAVNKAPESAGIKPVLNGIFLGTRHFAVIDGSIYQEGDDLNGRKIQSIEKTGVKLENGDTINAE
ncbi:MAG: hypothetical protein PHW04_11225 [Candidatus Wallbacteria bacterium]|nr:hypothetical protein [Candidatus Wallbacteria bacterium]